MVMHLQVVVLYQLHPSTLPHVQFRLCEDIFETLIDEDINYNASTSTPGAPSPAPPDAPSPQAPPGPITRARARELNFVMLLKNEGPED